MINLYRQSISLVKLFLILIILIAQLYFAYEWFYLSNYQFPTGAAVSDPNVYIQSVWAVRVITVLLFPISFFILWKFIKSR